MSDYETDHLGQINFLYVAYGGCNTSFFSYFPRKICYSQFCTIFWKSKGKLSINLNIYLHIPSYHKKHINNGSIVSTAEKREKKQRKKSSRSTVFCSYSLLSILYIIFDNTCNFKELWIEVL